jgi:hypothetical protein
MADDLQARLAAAKKETETLRAEIERHREDAHDMTIAEVAAEVGGPDEASFVPPKVRRSACSSFFVFLLFVFSCAIKDSLARSLALFFFLLLCY